LTASAEAGSMSLRVSDSGGFHANDEILIDTMTDPGGGFGVYEFRHLMAVLDDETVTLQEPLAHSYTGGAGVRHQVLRVPHFTSVNISATGALQAIPFRGFDHPVGGIIAFRCIG